jgi:hypothetical protein
MSSINQPLIIHLHSFSTTSLRVLDPFFRYMHVSLLDMELLRTRFLDTVVEFRLPGLRMPGLGSALAEHLDFFDGLAVGLRVAMSGQMTQPLYIRKPQQAYVKKTCTAAPMHRTPKVMNIFHVILRNPGGTKRPNAKLNSQLPVAAIP